MQGKLTNEDVDQRMVKTLGDLSESLGLEAIDKFAGSNLDTVRSRTGFMMGIIKRVDMEARGGPMMGRPPPYGGGYGGPPPYGGGGGYGALTKHNKSPPWRHFVGNQ